MGNLAHNILIVEDEFINSEFLKHALMQNGFINIHVSTNAEDAVRITANKRIDFVFMDININGSIDGIMCAKMINQKYDIPIVYTTAYCDSNTISEASDTNLYGYLIKPFNVKDIEAICKIVIKLGTKAEKPEINEDIVSITQNSTFDLERKTFTENNIVVKLSKNERLLLEILSKHINQCVSYDLIKDFVWKNKSIADSTMRDTISRLRRKALSLDIQSHSGVGYCLKRV